MTTSFFSQILMQMENPVVVGVLVAITLVIRFIWMRHRRQHPLSAAPARQEGRANTPAASHQRKDPVLEIIDTLLIALVLVFGIVRPYLLQTFFIPSESMVPTLKVSDKLIVNKFVLRNRMPARGEVIVFQPPVEAMEGGPTGELYRLRRWMVENPGALEKINPYLAQKINVNALPQVPTRREDYIKRVVGEPGDRVNVVPDDGVYINGKLIAEPFIPEGWSHGSFVFPAPTAAPGPPPDLRQRLSQTSDGLLQQQIATQTESEFSAWLYAWYNYEHLYKQRIEPYVNAQGEFVVPKNHVLVMGDNRDNSFDGRYWGLVPREAIRGRAISTFWPLNRLKLL